MLLARRLPTQLSLCTSSLSLPSVAPSHLGTQQRNVGSVGWGPYTKHRQNTRFAGVHRHPLKYHVIPMKTEREAYGVQDERDKQTQVGRCVAKLPVKMTLLKDHVYTWCACGMSGRQPLCDGTHNRTSLRVHMKPVRYIPDRDMEVWMCMCKQTKNRPFCDGSHASAKYPNEYTDEDMKDMRSKGKNL